MNKATDIYWQTFTSPNGLTLRAPQNCYNTVGYAASLSPDLTHAG